MSLTVTKRHGWLRPTDGARQASAINRSTLPSGKGSDRNRRTSRRHANRSERRVRNASSKVGGSAMRCPVTVLQARGSQQDQNFGDLLKRAKNISRLPADLSDREPTD